MKFIKRDVVVDAVRFVLTGEEKLNYFGDYPVFYDPDKETGIAYLRLATPDGSKRADVGDWIVKSSNGSLRVHTAEDFFQLFEGVTDNFAKNSEKKQQASHNKKQKNINRHKKDIKRKIIRRRA